MQERIILDRVFRDDEILQLRNGTLVAAQAYKQTKQKVDLKALSYADVRMYHRRKARVGKR